MRASSALTSSSAARHAGSSRPPAMLLVAVVLLYASVSASAAARSPQASAGDAFTAASNIKAPFTAATPASAGLAPLVST